LCFCTLFDMRSTKGTHYPDVILLVGYSHNRTSITVAEVVEYRSFIATLISRLEQLKVEVAETEGLMLK
jgi:hypothetical protein